MLSESIVIGIYGIQGVGKSYLLKQIAQERIEWNIIDGSQLIRNVLEVKGLTMDHFEKMTSTEKSAVRKEAIECVKDIPGVTLIAGHCSFPTNGTSNGDEPIQFNDVFTEADGSVYDFIIYLEKPVVEISHQINNDHTRVRTMYSTDNLQRWLDHEKSVIEAKCLEYNIDHCVFHPNESHCYHELVSIIVEKMILPASKRAKEMSEEELISAIKRDVPAADVYLLIDGDGTLCAQDTGETTQLRYSSAPKISCFDNCSILNLHTQGHITLNNWVLVLNPKSLFNRSSRDTKTIASKHFGKCQCCTAMLHLKSNTILFAKASEENMFKCFQPGSLF